MLPTITFTSIETVAIYKNHHKYFFLKLKIMNGIIGSIIIGALAGWLVGLYRPQRQRRLYMEHPYRHCRRIYWW